MPAHRRDAREAPRSGAPGQIQEHGLCLVLRLVGRGDHVAARVLPHAL